MDAGHGLLRRARAGDAVALAQLLVTVPSVNPRLSPEGDGEGEIAVLINELLCGWGLRAETREVAPGRRNVIAKLDGHGPTVLLNGHLDTVGVEGMTVPPFAAEMRGSRLFGRGAADMKGGVAALLAATAALAASGSTPPVLVVLTADEEHSSEGMQHAVRDGLHADLAIVCEPTGLAVMPAHKGFVWVRATFRGRAAHGSRPDLGVDAIRHAALFVASLDRYTSEHRVGGPHPLLGQRSLHAGTIAGGSAPSIYPDHCEVQLECRTLPGDSPDDVLSELQVALDELRRREPTMEARLEISLSRQGAEVPVFDPLVRGLLAACEAEGVPPLVAGMSAWVEASLLCEAGIPAVCFGPGRMEQAHASDEWIDAAEIVTCAAVIERFARSLAP